MFGEWTPVLCTTLLLRNCRNAGFSPWIPDLLWDKERAVSAPPSRSAEVNKLLCSCTTRVIVRWLTGEGLGQEMWVGSLWSRVPGIRKRTDDAGAEFNEELPWRRECPDLVFFTGWFPCSAPSAQFMWGTDQACFSMIHLALFQVFQLTALINCGPVNCC